MEFSQNCSNWAFCRYLYQVKSKNAIIAARMKRGGMRWSYEGINHMAALRSAQYSKNSFVDFHEARLKAFAFN